MILETVSKVRLCVVMLDLECDALISDMYQHFLKAIRYDIITDSAQHFCCCCTISSIYSMLLHACFSFGGINLNWIFIFTTISFLLQPLLFLNIRIVVMYLLKFQAAIHFGDETHQFSTLINLD